MIKIFFLIAGFLLATIVNADNGEFTLVDSQVGGFLEKIDKVKDGNVLVFKGSQKYLSLQVANFCDISSIRTFTDPEVGDRVLCVKVPKRKNVDYSFPHLR